jgi:hypothetical protein
VCGPEGIENGYEGVVVPDDECELLRGGRFLPGAKTGFIQRLGSNDQHPVLTGDSILPRASLKASLCCCCCCVTLCAAALESCSGYPRDLGGWDSEGFVFTSVGWKNRQSRSNGDDECDLKEGVRVRYEEKELLRSETKTYHNK